MSRIDTLLELAARRPDIRDVAAARASAAGTQADASWYRIVAAAAPAEPATVYLYDQIGGWFGVGADQFVRDLAAVDAPRINLHINSPGGDVFDAIAIHAALVNHPAQVHVAVDALAASAASFVAMAGETIGIEKPARMMIHDARGLTFGSPTDHQVMTDLLHSISDTIAGMYADRAGGSPTAWRDAMRANNDSGTWYTAAQAVDAGLADHIRNDTSTTTAAPDPGEGDTAPAAAADRRTQMIRALVRARSARG